MKISFEELDDKVIFRVSEFDPKYEPVLQSCFYQDDGRGYIKQHPKDAKYLDQIMRRYSAYAQTMFDQLGYFVDVPWAQGLRKFCAMMEPTGIDWWLTGSCVACIHGIPFNPHDVDIMLDSKDIPAVTELFQSVLIEPVIDTTGWVTKDFGVIFMDARIDIASDPVAMLDQPDPADCGPYARAHLETVRWEGFEIQAPPLELLLNVNRRRGRSERVRLLEEHLAQVKGRVRV